jgi:DNA modification methylase
MINVNNIYNEDCIGEKGMLLIDNDSIHLTCTSPPYYNAKEYASWATYDDYLIFIKKVFTEVYRVLKSGRMCVVNISPILVPRESRQHESKRLNLPAHLSVIMEEIGFKFIEDIQWIKPEGSSKNRNGSFYQNRTPISWKGNIINEYIYVFQKPMDGLIDKIVRSYNGEIKEQSLILEDYDRTNVWYMQPVTNSKHPAPFPKDLSDKVVKYYSYINDIVLDPFMGRGTTAISCIDLKRNYIGFEYKEEYIKLAESNIQNFKNGKYFR